MNLIIDGPNESGKDQLAEEILFGFEPERSDLIDEPTMREMIQTPTLFMRALIKNLDSNFISVWSRGWVSEIVRAKIDGFEVDEFAWEFLLRRLMIGRGDYFVVLPKTKELFYKQFSEDEFADSFVERGELSLEYDLFLEYAERWGYQVLYTDYSPENIKELSRSCRFAAISNNHAFSSEVYVGAHNPTITLVGDSFQEFPFDHRVFHSLTDLEYLRAFGKQAITDFGYCSGKQFHNVSESKWGGSLLRNPVMVDNRSQKFFPSFQKAEMVLGSREPIEIQTFKQDIKGILDRSKGTGK